jgi:hypothetical protein
MTWLLECSGEERFSADRGHLGDDDRPGGQALEQKSESGTDSYT